MHCNDQRPFIEIATGLERLRAARSEALETAFGTLARQIPDLATCLLDTLGGTARAAQWMSAHQKVFEGRTAWDVLGEGDEDTVWDALLAGREQEPVRSRALG